MSATEIPTPDPVSVLASVISASMEFETDLNSARCRTAIVIATSFADAMAAQNPDFDRAAFKDACKPSWMTA